MCRVCSGSAQAELLESVCVGCAQAVHRRKNDRLSVLRCDCELSEGHQQRFRDPRARMVLSVWAGLSDKF